jgi:hypothetical protein
MAVGADQPRRRLREVIVFEIEQPANPRPYLVMENADRQGLVDLFEKVLRGQSRDEGSEKKGAGQEGLHEAIPIG